MRSSHFGILWVLLGMAACPATVEAGWANSLLRYCGYGRGEGYHVGARCCAPDPTLYLGNMHLPVVQPTPRVLPEPVPKPARIPGMRW